MSPDSSPSLSPFAPDPEPESPAWLVTFGDTMSLLLTFFVLLISFSSFEEPVSITRALGSMSNHLGGGAVRGMSQVRATENLSPQEMEMVKKLMGIQLADTAIPDIKESVIDVDMNMFQKVNRLKKMLEENPALLHILIQKKAEQAVKKLDIDEESDAEEKEKNARFANLELSLQNLEHFIIAEEMERMISLSRKPNGEISFEIDCLALFNDGADTLRPESRQLLARIGKIFALLPNKVAIENFTSRYFDQSPQQMDQWMLSLSRSEQLIAFFTTECTDVGENRFIILARGYSNEAWNEVQKINSHGKGIIGLTILSYGE